MAYGTKSIARVDKIVGPGNLFVVLAKRMVFGQVGIEALPGPTECLVVADDSASPAWVAADLLAQAEHDPLACSLLITPDHGLAEAVDAELARYLGLRRLGHGSAGRQHNRRGHEIVLGLGQQVGRGQPRIGRRVDLSVGHA